MATTELGWTISVGKLADLVEGEAPSALRPPAPGDRCRGIYSFRPGRCFVPHQSPVVSFGVDPSARAHWEVTLDGAIATVTMRVSPDRGLLDDYELKLNSYDVAVDIELFDIVQRLRFEHPEVRAVVLTGGLDKVFCAGANIGMLAGSAHGHKVNFCKFTNETRNAIEEASASSGQVWLAAVNGTAAGGGYELALACDEILLIDDRSSAVSLPEVPLLAVLPGTGGLTRVVDKRKVRRDLADVFATRTEGVKGRQAVEWGLVDAIAPQSQFAELVRSRAEARAAGSDRPASAPGVELPVFGASTVVDDAGLRAENVTVEFDRANGVARFEVAGPRTPQPDTAGALASAGAERLAAGDGARAGPRHPAPPVQRARAGDVGAHDERRPRRRRRGRAGARDREPASAGG